jgi:hypothetical protein
MKYQLIFDSVILKQLKKAGKDHKTREILAKMLDKLELIGPYAGELIDSRLLLYEVKSKHPPIRLYFKLKGSQILVFEYEMKTSPEKQHDTINNLRRKISKDKLLS